MPYYPRSSLLVDDNTCPRLHYSVDLPVQTYTEPVPLKCGKLAANIRGYTDIFYSVASPSYKTMEWTLETP